MIGLTDVSYKYPRAKTEAVSRVSASFERGEIVAVTGKNGCGKTTLTKLMTGILRPSHGSITIDGADATRMDLFEIGRKAGYVFQNPSNQLFCVTVYDEIAYGLKNMGLAPSETDERIGFYLDFFRLGHLRDSLPDSLSLGEKQRVALACVLAMGTDYLILDEPTTGLDMRTREQLGELLLRVREKNGAGIVIVSHDAGFVAKFVDRQLPLISQ